MYSAEKQGIIETKTIIGGNTMQRLQNITLTKMNDLMMVHSVAGETHQVENRAWYGLSFCQSGQITYEHKGRKIISTPDTAIFLPMGETYTLYRDKTGDFPLINFYCTEDFSLPEILAIPLQFPETYLRDFAMMRELFAFPYNRHKVYMLFYGILNRLTNEITMRYGKQNGIQMLLSYIEKHYTDWDISIEVLSEVCGISEAYMRQLFRQKMGTTPKQYIMELRIEKAKQLLVETNMTMIAIAEGCGFGSAGNFGVYFRQTVGMTPSAYREGYRVVL